MRLEVVRLADLLAGAPYFASSVRLSRHGPHRHHDYVEVMAITGGEGVHTVFQDDRVFDRSEMRAGQLYLFRPQDVHSFAGTNATGLTLMNVAMPMAVWQRFVGLVGLESSWSRSTLPPMVTFDQGAPEVIEPFTRAVARFHDGSASMLDLLRFWGDVVPLVVPPRRRDETGFGAPRWLLSAVEAMLEESNLRAGLPRLVALAQVSSSYLSRVSQRHLGMTPTDLIANLRIRHATMLLSTTFDSVGTVAERCGFSSAAYFSNCFRRAMAMSPREYRRRLLGGYFDAPA